MLRVYAHRYIDLGRNMADARVHFDLVDDKITPENLAKYNGWLQADLQSLLKVCEELNLRTSAQLLGPRVENLPTSAGEFDVLLEAVTAELKGRLFLFVDPKHAGYFAPKQSLFGVEVAAKFNSIKYDIDEAGKCLALERSTATVFHLMRVMEGGIRALARCLAIADPIKPAEKNWGVILRRIKDDGLEKKWPTAAERATNDDAKLLEGLYASLDAVKNPLRNAAMHVEEIYTQEEAGLIFQLVKGFMKKLASRMDENGDPKA